MQRKNKTKQAIRKLVKKAEKEREYKKLRSEVIMFDAEHTLCTPGIYYLTFEGEIVYVGATDSLVQRMSQHYTEACKQFDAYCFHPKPGVSRHQLLDIERCEIKIHAPKYNKTHNNKK